MPQDIVKSRCRRLFSTFTDASAWGRRRHVCDDLVTTRIDIVTHLGHLRHNEYVQVDALTDAGDFGNSMLEEIRRTAERRLHEIEPLVEEAKRLRDILEVIEGRSLVHAKETGARDDRAPEQEPSRAARRAQSVQGADATRSETKPGGARSAGRAAKGSNKRAILALVAERPGITVAEISAATGMKRTVVASTVSRLKRYGELIAHESGGVCRPSDARGAIETASAIATVSGSAPARPRRQRLSALQRRRAA